MKLSGTRIFAIFWFIFRYSSLIFATAPLFSALADTWSKQHFPDLVVVKQSPLTKVLPLPPQEEDPGMMATAFRLSRVVSLAELEQVAREVILPTQRLLVSPGDVIYAQGLSGGEGCYGIYRLGKSYYQDDSSGPLLGVEAVMVGEAIVDQPGEVTQLRVSRANQEILPGDWLLPTDYSRFR